MPLPSPVDFSAPVSESSCVESLLNRVQWGLYLPAHRHEFITSASNKTPESSMVPLNTVDVLRGSVMKVWSDFFELVSGDRTWMTCCAVFYICTASFCSSKQTRRCAPPCGCLVLTVLVVMLHLPSTVDAAKLRPWRDATANVWAEGKPNSRAYLAMSPGPDGSLYVFGGESSVIDNTGDDNLYKLDVDTKEWHIITPRGSVRPSARKEHSMATVGSDLFIFGGSATTGEEARCVCWPSFKCMLRRLCSLC